MMQRVWQSDVNRVDVRVVHQCLEVAMDALHAEALSEGAPLGSRAAQAGGEPRVRALDHGRSNEISRNPTETHEAPTYRGRLFLHGYPSLYLRPKSAFVSRPAMGLHPVSWQRPSRPWMRSWTGIQRSSCSPRTCTPTASRVGSSGA